MAPDKRVPTETEASLIICSDNPQRIAEEIAGFSSIAEYKLIHQASKEIVDTYFDTLGCSLQDKRERHKRDRSSQDD